MKTRSVCKRFTLELGSIKSVGKLFSIRKTEDKLKLCTEDGTRVSQVYIDGEGGVHLNKTTLHRGIEVKGESKVHVIGDDEKVKEARTSGLNKDTMKFTVHSTKDVNNFVFPSNNQGYIFQPFLEKGSAAEKMANVTNYQAILGFMNDPSISLLGRANLIGHEGLFRAGMFRGHLYIQKQLYPEDLNEWDFDPINVDEKILEATTKVARSIMETFDPTKYNDVVAERIAILANGGELEEVDQTEAVLASIMSMMES